MKIKSKKCNIHTFFSNCCIFITISPKALKSLVFIAFFVSIISNFQAKINIINMY